MYASSAEFLLDPSTSSCLARTYWLAIELLDFSIKHAIEEFEHAEKAHALPGFIPVGDQATSPLPSFQAGYQIDPALYSTACPTWRRNPRLYPVVL